MTALPAQWRSCTTAAIGRLLLTPSLHTGDTLNQGEFLFYWTLPPTMSFMFVFKTQARFHRCDDVLLRPFILLWAVEGENASGHRGQEERETEAEGESAVKTLVVFYLCLASRFICHHFYWFQEQKRSIESSTVKHDVKKVRKARNRRQEWNMMALDKELRPDHSHPQSLQRGASSEGSLSPDGRYRKFTFSFVALLLFKTILIKTI